MSRRARVASALPAAVCAVLAVATGACASTTASLVRESPAGRAPDRPVYRFSLTTAPGERNDISLTFRPDTGARLTDAAAGVAAGPGCAVSGAELRCDLPSGGYPEAHLAGSLDQGEGDDRLILHATVAYPSRVQGDPETVVVHGGPGADDLDLGIGQFVADGGPGPDVIRARTVTYAGRTAPVSVTDDGFANDGEAGEGDDVRAAVVNADLGVKVQFHVIGGRADDHLTGDIVEGGGGDDRIETLWHAEGGDGNDVLSVVPGGSIVWAELIGGPGDDRITGGVGDDFLTGGPGADVVRGGPGTDQLLDLWPTPQPVRITLDDQPGDGPAGENDDIGADVESVSGGHGDDTLIGNDAANVLNGGPGDDVIDGRGGADELMSQGAHSHMAGGPGRDRISAPMSADLDLRDGELDYVTCAGKGVGRPGGERDAIDVLDDCQATVVLSTRRLRVTRGRHTAVRVLCPFDGPVCRGSLTLRIAGVAGSSTTVRVARRPLTDAAVPITLTARAAAVLRRHPKADAEARFVADGALQRAYWQTVNGPEAPFSEKDLSCHPPGREVLRTAPQAIYFQRIDQPLERYACLKGARLGVKFDGVPQDAPFRIADDMQFAGPFMTIQQDGDGCDPKACSGADAILVDLRTVRDVSWGRHFTGAVRLRANPAGDVAVIVRDYQDESDPGYPPGPGPFRVDLVDARGRRTVDRGTGIDPNVLTVDGLTVTWRHDGVERTANLAESKKITR